MGKNKEEKKSEELNDLSVFSKLMSDVLPPKPEEEGGELKINNLLDFDNDPESKEKEDLEGDTKKKDEPAKKTPKADEEEEDEEFEEEEEIDEDSQEIDEEEENVYTIWAKDLSKNGTIEIPEGFEIKSEEDLQEAVGHTITTYVKEGVEAYKKSLGEESLKFIEFVENGGNPAKYIEYKSSTKVSNLTSEAIADDEDLQKKLIGAYLKSQDFDDDEIEAKITKYEASGILEDEAETALKRLKKIEEKRESELLENAKRQKEENKIAYEKHLTELEADINKKEELAGFKLTPKAKKDFFSYITKPVSKDGKTALMIDNEKDPEAQLKMAWLMFNKFDFSKLEKKIETKAASKLKEKLSNYSDSREKMAGSKTPKIETSKDDMDTIKKALQRIY